MYSNHRFTSAIIGAGVLVLVMARMDVSIARVICKALVAIVNVIMKDSMILAVIYSRIFHMQEQYVYRVNKKTGLMPCF